MYHYYIEGGKGLNSLPEKLKTENLNLCIFVTKNTPFLQAKCNLKSALEVDKQRFKRENATPRYEEKA